MHPEGAPQEEKHWFSPGNPESAAVIAVRNAIELLKKARENDPQNADLLDVEDSLRIAMRTLLELGEQPPSDQKHKSVQ